MKKLILVTSLIVMSMSTTALAGNITNEKCIINTNSTYNNWCNQNKPTETTTKNCNIIKPVETTTKNCFESTTVIVTKPTFTTEVTTQATKPTFTTEATTEVTTQATKPTFTTEATTEETTQATKPTFTTEATTEVTTQATKPTFTTEATTEETTKITETTTVATETTTSKVTETTTETTTSTVDNSVASKLLNLVNKARNENGLSSLTLNSSLSNVAQKKAEDMKNNNYFSHTSPTYGSPFDMIKSFGINYKTAGENIAKGQKTAEEVFNAWMNSSGHRANILNKNFTQMGIGYTSGNTYWSQMFIG
ncbi:MAG: CAP domain-containing protein [Lachnospirales bacterium]